MTILLAALLALTAQPERPYRARVVIEEESAAGDSVSRSTGTAIVKPGEALAAEVAGTRVLVRGGEWTERRRRAKSPPLRDGGFHPLELWALDREAIERRFEAVPEEIPAERPLPEGVADAEGRPVAPLRAERNDRSRAIAGADAGPALELVRLTPREAPPKGRGLVIRAWRDGPSGRLVRVEVEAGPRRTACALEEIRELESVDDRWFELEKR